VKEFFPSRLQPLEDVYDELLIEERAKLASINALERADAIAGLAQSGSTFSTLLNDANSEWLVSDLVGRGDMSVDAMVLDAAFKAPVSRDGSRVYSAHQLADGNVLVLGIIDVEDGTYNTDDQSAQQFIQQFYGSMYANSEFEAFVEELKRNAVIEIN